MEGIYGNARFRHLVPFEGVMKYIKDIADGDGFGPLNSDEIKGIVVLSIYNGFNLMIASNLISKGLEKILN